MSRFKITTSDPPGFKEVEYIKLFDEAGETWALHYAERTHALETCYVVSHYSTGRLLFEAAYKSPRAAIADARRFILKYEDEITTVTGKYPTLNEKS